MEGGRAASWPYGLSSQDLWGQRGAPGQRAQRRGGAAGAPLQGPWQPWTYYRQQQQSWGPYSSEPGQGVMVLEYLLVGGGPSGIEPGQGFQRPGGPYSSEPGLCPRLPPDIQQPGAFYNGEEGPGPQLAGGPYNVAGSGPGGHYSPDMGLCVQQPGDYGPGLGGRAPIPQLRGPYSSPQNKNLGCRSGGPEQGWAGPPVNVVQGRNFSPAGERRRKGVSKSSPPTLESSNDQSSASTEPKQENKEQSLITKRPKWSLQRLRAIKVEPFPTHCSMLTIQAALRYMFGKFGEITSIQVNGKGEERSAMVFYKFVKDRNNALLGTQGTSLFNTKMYVTVWPYKKTQSSTAEIESEFFAEEGSATLYISNLEKDVLRDDLSNTLTYFGGIIYTEIQTLPGPYNYGVVQFTDQSNVQKAISEMNGLFLSRTKLKEKFGDSVSSNCIYLHGLFKTNFTVQTLVHHFCQFGTLEKVLLNRLTGKALVFFQDVSSAEKAIHKMREGSDGHLLTGDYAHCEFVARFYYSFKTRCKDTRGFALVFGEPSEHRVKILAKKNETQILADGSEEQDILAGAGKEDGTDILAKATQEEEADMLAEASEEEEEEADMLAEAEAAADMLTEASEKEADMLAEAEQAAIMLEEAGEEEEADMLAEASEEEDEADLLAEDGEENTEVLDEAGEEEVAPLLDLSEKTEVSSDSGEEAAEPLPEVDEKITRAFAYPVK